MQLLGILFHVTMKQCVHATNVKYCRAGQSVRACTMSKIMDGEVDWKEVWWCGWVYATQVQMTGSNVPVHPTCGRHRVQAP